MRRRWIEQSDGAYSTTVRVDLLVSREEWDVISAAPGRQKSEKSVAEVIREEVAIIFDAQLIADRLLQRYEEESDR